VARLLHFGLELTLLETTFFIEIGREVATGQIQLFWLAVDVDHLPARAIGGVEPPGPLHVIIEIEEVEDTLTAQGRREDLGEGPEIAKDQLAHEGQRLPVSHQNPWSPAGALGPAFTLGDWLGPWPMLSPGLNLSFDLIYVLRPNPS
jgi:hypothetical protein